MNDPVITGSSRPVAYEVPETRRKFINQTYMHLLGAILLLVGLEVFLFKSGIAQKIAMPMLDNWLITLGAFMLVGWGASHIASKHFSRRSQYIFLFVIVALEAVILSALLFQAIYLLGQPGIIESAAVVTLLGFGVLTAIVFFTGADFSFMRSLLMWVGGMAIVAIVASLLFGFHLGTWFSVAMVAFAGASVLYDTSNVLHHFSEDRYVAASIDLFSSIALMFWYVLRIFMSQD